MEAQPICTMAEVMQDDMSCIAVMCTTTGLLFFFFLNIYRQELSQQQLGALTAGL